jgi:hypothetical protein
VAQTVAGLASEFFGPLPSICYASISSAARSHSQLAAENLFLRKQLAFYVERQVKPRRADDATRITLVALSSLIEWRRILMIVKPDTLIGWHRKGFQLFWRRKSKPRGRPQLPSDLRKLIRDVATPNSCGSQVPCSLWGWPWFDSRTCKSASECFEDDV